VPDYQRQLAAAERHIAETKDFIARQLDTLATLRREGKDVKQAEKLLASWLDSLAAFEAHQRDIMEQLARIGRQGST
jgi:hypothetical protein